jgi:hypothetical protein
VSDAREFTRLMKQYAAGQQVTLAIKRGEEVFDVELTLGERR